MDTLPSAVSASNPPLSQFPLAAEGTQAPAGGGVARLFFAVEQSLDSIARAVPEASKDIDEVQQTLRGILVSILQQKGSDRNASGLPNAGGQAPFPSTETSF